MKLTLYVPADTVLHRLHPVAKVLAVLGFFVAAFVSQSPLQTAGLAFAIVGLSWVAGARRNLVRFRWFLTLVFGTTFLVWSAFYTSNQPWFAWGPFHPGPDGLRFALAMAFKLLAFFCGGLLFLSCTRIEEFADALRLLGVPAKLGFVLTLAFRLVPVFVEAAIAVVQAQRCRGFDFDRGGWLERMRRYLPIIVPVFIGALRRADQMAMALEARGFQRRGQRTYFRAYAWRGVDVVVLVACGCAVGLWLWWIGATWPG